LPKPRRSLFAEDPEVAQDLVERWNVARPGRQHRGLGVHQLQHVADGDVGQGSALGDEDHGCALRGEPCCPPVDPRAGLAVLT